MSRRLHLLLLFGLTLLTTVSAQYTEPTWIRSGVGSPVVDLAFSPNNRYLASIAANGGIKIWDLQSNRLYRYVGNAVATSAAFFSDNQRLATGGTDGTVRIWNINTGEQVQSIQAHNGRVSGVDISPNGQLIASAGSDAEVKIWNTSNWSLARTITGHTGAVNSVDFSPDNSNVVSASDDRSVRIWSVATGVQQRIWNDTALHLSKGAVYSPNGSYVAATSGQCFYTSTGCGIILLNASSGATVKQYTQIRLDASDVVYSPTGLYVASSDNYGTVYTYRPDSTNLNPVVRLRHQAGPQPNNFLAASVVQFNSDGTMLASAGDDRVIRFWRASNNQTGLLIDSSGTILATAVNGTRVASGRGDGVVAIRSAETGDLQRLLTKIDSSRSSLDGRWSYHAGRPINAVAWRPDGNRLASGQDDDTIRVWDPTAGSLIRSIEAGARTSSLGWTTAGDRLLSGHGSPINGVRVWNASNWSPERTLDAAGAKVSAITVTATYVAAGCDDGMLRIWKTADWTPFRAVSAHTGAILDVAISGDGKYVATATADSFRITTLAEGAEVSNGVAVSGSIRSIAFSSDNNYLLATTASGSIVVYRALSGYASYVNAEYNGDALSMDVAGTDVFVGTVDGSVVKWPFNPGDASGELPAPTQITPANASTGVSSPVLLGWGSVAGVTGYDVQVSTEASFTTGIIVNQVNLIDTQRVVPNVTDGSTYYWRVRARAASGQSPWSPVWTFTTSGGATILAPGLKDPADRATNLPLSVTLVWEKGLGAEWYRLQLADNDAFSLPKVDEQQVFDSSYTVNGLSVGTTYYWHVRSRRNGSPSTSPWSVTRSFTTTTTTSVRTTDAKTGLTVAVAPNPLSDIGGIVITAPGSGRLRVGLVDNVGRQVRELVDEQVTGPEQRMVQFDVSSIASGSYFLQVEWNGVVVARPVVVAR